MGVLKADLQHILNRLIEANEVIIDHNKDLDRLGKGKYTAQEEEEVKALLAQIARQVVILKATTERVK